ncbi:DinB family protein [Hydrotalea sp.]|uniref:DinB family protein n=1 Tax=Hydrotalea sp. TaxID=2881279 RepID=UPI002628DE41|nr:DinB family protein [Hydrotalea sp.]
MEVLQQQIVDTWFIHHRINVMLIEALTDEALMFTTSKRGGGSVGHQLAHMYNVRFWKLERMHQPWVAHLNTIKADDVKTINSLHSMHAVSAALIGDVLKEGMANGGVVKGFKRGVVPLLGYFIAHEAHHRGNILLTLKLCGFTLPDTLKYGIWEWNKI